MTDLLKPELLGFVLYYIVPGFIATRFYQFVIPSEHRNVGDSLLEFLSFSIFYLALFFSLIHFVNKPDIKSNEGLYDLSTFVVVFIIPSIFGYTVARIRQSSVLYRFLSISDPRPPWDSAFSGGNAYWLVCHLKSGETIGGPYEQNSRASAFPNSKEIYFEKVWQLDNTNHHFLHPYKLSAGAIVKQEDCYYIELFENKRSAGENDGQNKTSTLHEANNSQDSRNFRTSRPKKKG